MFFTEWSVKGWTYQCSGALLDPGKAAGKGNFRYTQNEQTPYGGRAYFRVYVHTYNPLHEKETVNEPEAREE